MFGVAAASASVAVGSRGLFARAGIGALVTQYRSDPRLGPLGLELLSYGKSAQEALDSLVVTATPHHGWRQLAVIDRAGRIAHYAGGNIEGVYAAAVRPGVVALGESLADRAVPQAEVDAFAEDARPPLPERLLRGLEAGLAAGGDIEPLRSAALLIVYRESFPSVDLRIDDSPDPIAALRRLLQAYEPQAEEFVLHAIAPDRADWGRMR